MDSYWNSLFLPFLFLLMCVSHLMSSPLRSLRYASHEEETEGTGTVFDLMDDKDIDFSDQTDNIIALAEQLVHFGYLNLKTGFTADDLNSTEMNIQIANFQQNAGIKVTGSITGSTIVAAKSPRCGLSDYNPNHNETDRNKRYVTAGSRLKWNKNRITWRIDSLPTNSDIKKGKVHDDIADAFKTWSDVTPLEFVEIKSDDTRSDIDIRIEFQKKKHNNDPREPAFDGRGGTLAHAFYPNGGWGHIDGDIHFDDDEVFTTKNKDIGTNLFYTAAHEIGHSLGLQHSSNPSALMNAWDKGYVKDFKLSKDDVMGIQSIYGTNPNQRTEDSHVVESATTKRPVATTEATVSHGDCENAKIAVAVIDGSLFVFQGEHLWRYKGIHTNQILLTPLHGFPIRRFLKNGPKSIDAAFTYSNGSAALIRGKNVWVYDISTRRMIGPPGTYPMRISKAFGIPRDIDAAFHDSLSGIAYFFKDDQLWKYDTVNNVLLTENSNSSSIPATDEFEGLPVPINGAYADDHGHQYLIKDQKYWRYDAGNKTPIAGYPRLFAFLDCH